MCDKRNNGTIARCYPMHLLLEQTNGVSEVSLDGSPIPFSLQAATGIVFAARTTNRLEEMTAVAFKCCPFTGTKL